MAVLEGFASSEPFSVPTVDVLSFVYEYERDAGEDVEKPVCLLRHGIAKEADSAGVSRSTSMPRTRLGG